MSENHADIDAIERRLADYSRPNAISDPNYTENLRAILGYVPAILSELRASRAALAETDRTARIVRVLDGWTEEARAGMVRAIFNRWPQALADLWPDTVSHTFDVARTEALEEAEQVCEEEALLNKAAGWEGRTQGAYGCRNRIRALAKDGGGK